MSDHKQEPVADRLIRAYVSALVANKPDDAADATKRMVDYVYTTPQPQQWVGLTDADLANCDTTECETARHWERLLREKNS